MHLRSSILKRPGLVFLCAGLLGPTVASAQDRGQARASAVDSSVDFNRDIRPILAGRCFTCHGPDAAKRKGGPKGRGGMRLDTPGGSRADLGGHRAVVPGRPEASELLRRIQATDGDRMPPRSAGDGLSPKEIALFRRWIADGAEYAKHWSFVKPERPQPPGVSDDAWPRNAIDRFTLARLDREGLRPSVTAARQTLIRRASLDLTGLPPTLQEVDSFVADTDGRAYDKLIDRLLASPKFGEHYARHWLDLARYADTAGYADDPRRTIWGYRDWVVRALNENLPFDEFTVQQIAGDLLPNPTDDQLVATAMHRNTMTNNEGGTDNEEFRSIAVVDRVNTTMAVWMGTTMACAQCHDHKYDPLSQKEFFQLYAFFNTTQDSDLRNERPVLPLFSKKQRLDRVRLDDELAKLRKTLTLDSPELAAGQSAWDREFPRDAEWSEFEATPVESSESVRVTTNLEVVTAIRITAAKKLPKRFVVRLTPKKSRSVNARFVRVSRPGKNLFLSLAEVQVFQGAENIAPSGKARQVSTGFNGPAKLANDGNTDGHFSRAKSTTHTNRAKDPWWEVDLGKPRPIDSVVIWNRTDSYGQRLKSFRVELLDAERKPVWTEDVKREPKPDVELSPGGARTVSVAATWPFAGADGATTTLILSESLSLEGATLEIGIPKGKKPTKLRFAGSSDPAFAKYRTTPESSLSLLDLRGEKRTKGQKDALHRHYRSVAPELEPTRKRVAAVEKSIARIKPHTTVPILREQPVAQRRKTRIQIRGNFLQTGDEVSSGVPAIFHPLEEGASRNRLALARWLVAPDNPLTARVVVNRYWELLFGVGLVATSEDFGIRGELPSHPGLLDWLATEFVASGWDMKGLLRRIVTSATYRQDSKASAELRRRDPTNRLLARGPRLRLSAEMIRDQALAVSGLLSPKMFGAPVRPPRPNLGLRAAFGGSTDWKNSVGADRYRRGLYTFWQRSIPYPSMAAFDAPSRQICTVRRLPTNTPLQALVTLNDPVYVEAAQALGRRMVAAGESTAQRAAFGFRLCLSRKPRAKELSRLVAMFDHAARRYSSDPAAAKLLATKPIGPPPEGSDVVELAAWTVVANVLLNLDEVLVKR